METQIKFAVICHHMRMDQANRIAELLGKDCVLFIDHVGNGANANHRRALEWATEQDCRVVVLEDDALPVEGFASLVTDWLARFPDNLISFYLGTGRPPQYQMQIAERLVIADKNRDDFITMPRLIHGVCYSVPQQYLSRVLARWESNKAADYAVGDACGGTVVYPCYSLIEHADGSPVEKHPDNLPRSERRRAWRLEGAVCLR